MKIKDYKCKCGNNEFFFVDKGCQKGMYCSYCGKWFKWADKDEQNLALEQEPILDKIRAEIEKLRPNLRPEQMTDYDYAMVLAVETLETIIDEYKAESEGKE